MPSPTRRALLVRLVVTVSKNRFFYFRLLLCVMLVSAALWMGSGSTSARKQTAWSSGAAQIQRAAIKTQPGPQSLPSVQTRITQDAGGGLFKPYAPPPKADRARRPALPGSDVVEFSAPRKLTAAQERQMLMVPMGPVSTFTIVIVPGAGLAANPAALAAFEAAADEWETRFNDPITVVINADLAPLGPGIIGSAGSQLLAGGYNTIRNAVVADATSSADASDNIATSLPTAALFVGALPVGFAFDGNVFATKANLKALGFTGLDVIVGTASDGEITFSSDFSFDYDRSNGVSPSTIDFQTVAAHEIGHVLGFISAVDDVDFVLPGTASNIEPTPLDLFRFANASKPTNPATFTSNARNFVPGAAGVTSDTVTSPLMSTGLDFGDGRQASHWKDDSLTAILIGVMDPTLSFATFTTVNNTDVHAFDLVGYDLAPSNTAPVASASPNPVVTDEDTAIQITLTGTDTEDDDQTFEVTDTPDHGSLGTISTPDCTPTNTCTATVTYTPAFDYNGPDSFKFKANDGTVDSTEVTVNITVNAVPDFTISNVSQAEGNAGTSSFTFTVTKTGAGAATVDFATEDDTVDDMATVVSDYASNSGTLNFASGDTTKPITVLVNGDTTPETDETFLVRLSNASGAAINDDTGVGTILNDDESVSAGQLIISEFRLRGPGASGPPLGPSGTPSLLALSPCGGSHSTVKGSKGKRRFLSNPKVPVPNGTPPDLSPEANDEFIELYNNSDSPLLVTTTDGSSGWAVAASDGLVRFIIPTGTVIPPRAHFLSPNLLGYSLGSMANADFVIRGDSSTCFGYEIDIPDNAGIALFRTSTPANFSTTTRLDAAGSTAEPNTLYREGAGYPALSPTDISLNLEHSFFRSMCSFVNGVGCTTPGVPKDADNNASDFLFVDTQGTLTAAGQRLGAPGPEGLTSPVRRDTTGIALPLLDPSLPASTSNRSRALTDAVYGSPFGTMTIRRRVTNNTGSPVTQLRFRIVEITTWPAPAGIADLRARTGVDESGISVTNQPVCTASGAGVAPCTVTVLKTTLDEPPTQSIGGGLNSTLRVTLGAPLADGQSVNVNFLLGVHQTGTFRFLLIVEALP